MAETDPADVLWASRVNNHGSALRDRYKETGTVVDLEEVVAAVELLAARPEAPAVERVVYASNAGQSFRELYDVTADIGLLRRAMKFHRMALRLSEDEPAADLSRVLDALVLAVRWSADLASPCRQDAARGPPTLREFLVKVPESRRWWETHRVTRCAHGVQHFRHTLVGSLSLQYETLTFLADTDQALCRTQRKAGSPSAEALALLASWSAPSSPAPAIHT